MTSYTLYVISGIGKQIVETRENNSCIYGLERSCHKKTVACHVASLDFCS